MLPRKPGPRAKSNGTRGGGRTHNLRLRRPTLYPIELLAQDGPKLGQSRPCGNLFYPSRKLRESSKFQIPKSKLQRNPKFQLLKVCRQDGLWALELDVWDFLGVWDLELPHLGCHKWRFS